MGCINPKNMKNTLLLFFILTSFTSRAQLGPEVTSWIQNPGSETGYNNILSNVQLVQYSNDFVYVSATCIPGYDIGPWAGNPNTPANQNFVFKITRNPIQNTGTLTNTPLGHIGIWSNGVSMFNAKDAFSYNNLGVWNRNAIVAEGPSFDDCMGHPAPNGEYHTHLNPECLYNFTDNSQHAPIIGYAFDGFPVYGAYGYDNPDGSGGIRRMESSYRLREISTRTTLPNGTSLNASQYGPAINATYPLGLYLEDFEYVDGLGDLDEHNGRFCITPEYPQGTYAYFVTLNDMLEATYPYTLGPTYYGVVTPGNTGPQSGHVVVSEPVNIYNPISTAIYPFEDESVQVIIDEDGIRLSNNASFSLYTIDGRMLYEGKRYSADRFSPGLLMLKSASVKARIQVRNALTE